MLLLSRFFVFVLGVLGFIFVFVLGFCWFGAVRVCLYVFGFIINLRICCIHFFVYHNLKESLMLSYVDHNRLLWFHFWNAIFVLF